MRTLPLLVWPMAFALALSACAANSPRVVPVECPKPAALPASLMAPPNFEQQLRELWLSDKPAMPA